MTANSAIADLHGRRYQRLPYPYQLHPRAQPSLSSDYHFTISLDALAQQDLRIPLDKPRAISIAILQCWKPAASATQPAQEITVRMGFKRDGSILGVPKITYIKAATPGEGDALRADFMAALQRCTPLAFTPGLGSAIAGRIFNMRFILKSGASHSI